MNRVWILRRTNRELGNKSPYEYLSQEILAAQAKDLSSKLQERLDGQCIPLEAISLFRDEPVEQAFEAFLDERARAIELRLVERIGSKYVAHTTLGEDPSDVDEDDEVD
jgi:hypothetical protein